MKLSFTTMATPELMVCQQAQAVKRFGFHAVDLRMQTGGSGEIPENADAKCLKRIRENAGTVSSILCYNKQIDVGIEEMADSVRHHLEIAKAINAPAIRIFTGKLKDGEERHVCRALEYALADGPSGVDIVIQNHLNASTTVHQAVTICKVLNTERVGIVLSPDHARMIGEEIAMDETLPYVKQLYIAGDETRNMGIPTQELQPIYRRIIQALPEHHYDGYLTLKWERCWRNELAAYDVVFPQFMEWIESCWNQET